MADSVFEGSVDFRPAIADEDQRLVSAAQQDPEAAGRLYDKYYREIFGYLYHGTLDRPATEDLTSNVFLAAFRHLGRYRWQRVPFRAWLYRIATNELRMYYRRRRRDKRADLAHGESAEPVDLPASEGPAVAEEVRLLHRALLELKLKYRTVILLRYFEGRTIEEISGITGRREGTIKSQLHRGLAQLQEILVRWGVLPQ